MGVRVDRKPHIYPNKRKKKRKHIQWFNLERVVKDWGFIPEYHYVFDLKSRGWWVCKEEPNAFCGNFEYEKRFFRRVYPLKVFDGKNGMMVLGYVGVITYSHMSIHNGRFVFVKDAMNPAHALNYAVSIKREEKLREHIQIITEND